MFQSQTSYAPITSQELSINDEIRWNQLLDLSLNYNYLTTLKYAHRNQNTDIKTTTYIFVRDGIDIAGVHYSFKRVKCIFTTADIRYGIVFKYNPDENLLSFIIDHFIKWSVKNNASYVTVNSWLPATIGQKTQECCNIFDAVMGMWRFRKILMGSHTYWIDLSCSEEDLQKNMKRQTRYEIRKGIKSDVSISQYKKPDNNLIERFWVIYKKLGEKKDITIMSENKFKKEIECLTSYDLATLFVATYNDVIINMSLCSNIGRASYMYGAINPDFKKLKNCPSPGQLVQWEMMMTMKRKGIKIYDLGFCPGPIPQPGHKAYQIWRFKYGFGGDHVQFLPTYGKVLKPVRGKLFEMLRYRHKPSG